MKRGALALLTAGCEPRVELKPGDPEVVRAAQQIFETRCANCHGPRGRGDGPGGRALWPRPRDFGDPAWQAGADDSHLRKVIVQGGASVGLSPQMQPNPDLADSPAVVGELIGIIRGFAPAPEAKSASPETDKPGP
ncbi:c-type cytochrome [Nannocystis punicea]|uniref:C-type cytochrome n=1 Tax=Nannocystis punicea TaxID=2995304 RepID=A0ABY7HGV6_9BACT|nr:c-type cytochrome [Nannocystis poenicansa]WAS98446.1 c-type cytochrome [Nannocystis poenicansa]